MNIQCIICIGLVNQASDIYTTPCGHIFHYGCLLQWLEKKKTCPQCRAPVSERRIQRLFFNFASDATDNDDPVSLQHVVDDLKFKVVLKNEEITKLVEKNTTLETQVTGLRKEVRKVEKEIAVATSTIHTLRDQAKYFKEQSAESEILRKEVLKLREEMVKLKSVQDIITASADEVESIISRTTDPTALSTYVSVIKREMMTMMNKTKEHRTQIKNLKMELSKVSMERNMLLDVRDRCKRLEEELQTCESEKIVLQNKLQDLNGCMSRNKYSKPSGSVNKTERLKIDLDANIKLEKRIGEKSNDQEENRESEPVINFDDGENSPYLPVKSQGVFAIKRGHALRSIGAKSHSGLSKKRPSNSQRSDCSPDKMEQYDGFGSHSKYDHFPEPNPSLKLKRTKDDPSKAKKQKQLNDFLDFP